jgi:hypothetical protein
MRSKSAIADTLHHLKSLCDRISKAEAGCHDDHSFPESFCGESDTNIDGVTEVRLSSFPSSFRAFFPIFQKFAAVQN